MIQGGTSATALGFSPAALALCERVLPDETLRSAEAAAVALAAAFASLSVAGPPEPAAGAQASGGAATAGGCGLGAARDGDRVCSIVKNRPFGPQGPPLAARAHKKILRRPERPQKTTY